MRVGKKLSYSTVSIYIDTQGRGVHGPDERGLERLFTHNVKLYNCAVGLCGTNPELQYDGRLKDVRNGWCQMVNIISL